jgi:hypothetical protein
MNVAEFVGGSGGHGGIGAWNGRYSPQLVNIGIPLLY